MVRRWNRFNTLLCTFAHQINPKYCDSIYMADLGGENSNKVEEVAMG
jgi:hypothetical protein